MCAAWWDEGLVCGPQQCSGDRSEPELSRSWSHRLHEWKRWWIQQPSPEKHEESCGWKHQGERGFDRLFVKCCSMVLVVLHIWSISSWAGELIFWSVCYSWHQKLRLSFTGLWTFHLSYQPICMEETWWPITHMMRHAVVRKHQTHTHKCIYAVYSVLLEIKIKKHIFALFNIICHINIPFCISWF